LGFIKTYYLQKVYTCLDDIPVTGATVAEHDKNLSCLLAAAADCRLTLNEEVTDSRDNTCHPISFNKVEPDPDRLQPLLDLPPPTNLKELKRASGVFSYYSKWIPNFSATAPPLLRTTCFPLSESAFRAFDELKRALAKASLDAIRHGVPFSVETDASDYALAAILSQDGRSVAYVAHLNCLRKTLPCG